MKHFIMGLILAVVSIGASAAPSISEDQLRRIAAIRVGISSVLYGRDMYYDHEQVVGTPG